MFFLKDLPTRDMISGYVDAAEIGDPAKVEDALIMMRRASILVRSIDTYFSSHGLSQLKFLILVVIDREPEKTSLRQSEILQRLDVSKPVLHRTVAAMVADNLLKQETDPDDQRASRLSLTPSGTAALASILPGYFKIITEFMDEDAS